MEASARTRHARELFAPLGPTYDRYARLLSFGQDPRWRSFLVSRIPPDARRVLDVASGTAAVAIELARAEPERTVVGVDQSPEMLAAGRERVEHAGLSERVELREGRAEELPFADEEFDALTFTYLLRYVDDVPATLRELVACRAARRDGGDARVRPPARRLAAALGALRARRAARGGGRRLARAGAESAAFSARASASSGGSGRSRASSTRGARPASPTSRRGG